MTVRHMGLLGKKKKKNVKLNPVITMSANSPSK